MSITNFIGVDPGLHGGIAQILEPPKIGGIITYNFHTTPVEKGSNERNQFVIPELVKIFKPFENSRDTLIGIENVRSSPQMGVSSSFSFGFGFGLYIAIFESLNISYCRIEPVVWKKKMIHMAGYLPTKDRNERKLQAVDRAAKLFPLVKDCFMKYTSTGKLRVDDGIAEALLLAEFVRQSIQEPTDLDKKSKKKQINTYGNLFKS